MTVLPSEAAVSLVYRQAILEGVVLPRLRTEAGTDTMVRRWHGIAETVTPEEQVTQLTDALVAVDDATASVSAWAEQHIPPNRGCSLPLPVPQSSQDRWEGAHRWAEGALSDPKVINHPRVQRIGRQHRPWLLRALASYADHATGHHVTAANRTIGRQAAALVAEHIAGGGTWTGRRTDQLSDVTLAGQVSNLVAALIEAGWMRERARGRHLNRLERAVAWLRTRLHQTRAASVRDLTVPDHARRTPTPTTPAPAWVHPGNPYSHRLAGEDLLATLRRLLTLPVLHTHLPVGQLSYLVTVCRGLLTRKTPRETPPSRKTTDQPQPRPTLAAQKTAAGLVQRLPWLLRGRTPGRRRHIGALARLLEETGFAQVGAGHITAAIDATLTAHGWELHPASIASPLGWLRNVLDNLRSAG